MDVFEVENKRQLMAAVRARADDSGGFLVMMVDAPTVYKFPLGLSEARASELCKNIRRTPASAFRSEK